MNMTVIVIMALLGLVVVVITKMNFSIVGYFQNINTGAVFAPIAALVDQHITMVGNNIVVPGFLKKIYGAFIMSAWIQRGRIVAPSMRATSYPEIGQLNDPYMIGTPWHVEWYKDRPKDLDVGENLQCHVEEAGAGAQNMFGLYIMSDGMVDAPDGEEECVEAIGATLLVANVWTLCPMVPVQQLRSGRYAVVGMRAESAGAVAARLVPPGGAYRPGCIGTRSPGAPCIPEFRYGNLGKFCEFDAAFFPAVEFLSQTGDLAERVFLDVIRIGDST